MDEDGARASALSVYCRAISVRRPRLAHRLSQLSAAVLVAFPLGSVVYVAARAFGVQLPRGVSAELLWAWVLSASGLALLSALVGVRAPARPGKIEVDADSVRVSQPHRSWSIRALDVVAGLVLPTTTGPAVDLQLRDGRLIRAGIYDERDAHAVLDRLGVGPDCRRVAVMLGNPNRALAAGIVAFPIAAILWLVVIIAFVPYTWSDRWVGPAWALLVTASTLLARRMATPPEITIGADAVLIRRGWGTRLVPFADVEDAISAGGRLVIDLRGGPLGGARIEVNGSDPWIVAGLADRIRDAMRVVRGQANAAATAHLDPAGRSLTEWREALGKLLKGGADYRRSALGADELLAVLEDASAPPTRRIGAAIALRDGASPEAQRRVRIAADACADEEVRAALEAAAEAENDEAPIRRVLGG